MSYLKIKKRPTHRVNINNFLSGVDTFSDESVMSPSVASQCYNFDFTSGALEYATGFSNSGISADSVWVFHPDDMNEEFLMYSYKGEIFYIRTDTGESGKLEGIRLTSLPTTIKYRLYGKDVILICSPTDNMVVWNGVDPAYYVSSSPLITSMTMHYERMFVTTSNDKNTLWFSDDLDPTNWNSEMSEGGFIELADERGALIKVVSFLNYVYIFRENGISRLTAYADQSEFSISHLYVTSGKIYPKSIAVCGDKVMFASSDGIYVFDGVSTKRILSNLDNLLVPNENAIGAYHDGKYFLAMFARFKNADGFPTKFVNNAVLVFDDKGYTILRGYDIKYLSAYDKLYAIIDGTIHSYEGVCPYPQRWAIPYTDLGSARAKKIKTLYIETREDITLTVNIDGNEKIFLVKGKAGPSLVNINMIGRKFGLTIDATHPFPFITRPQLSFDIIDR